MQSTRNFTKVFIGGDHAALELKALLIEYLQKQYIDIEDKGTSTKESCDYPLFAFQVGESVVKTPGSLGIVVCGSGIGISIAANKVKGVRCGLCHDYYTALMARTRDHCNVVSIGARVTGSEVAKQIVDVFLNSEPSQDPKYLQRVQQINDFEEQQYKKE